MKPLDVLLKHLKSFVADWQGEPVGEEGLVHVLNRDGGRPPLIWCFNARDEFPALAGALGPDQPLIGLRSLNVLVDYRKRPQASDVLVAEHYLRILRRHFDVSRCWVGGNCQGASVAAELSRLLVQDGAGVGAFIAMEWTPLIPFPGHCAMVYGAESRDFNPFLQKRDPWPLWRHMFAAASCHIIPGGHGTYFQPETVGHLAAVVRDIIAAGEGPGIRRQDEPEPLVVEPPPSQVGVEEPLCVLIARRCLERSDSRLYAAWISEGTARHIGTLHKPLLSAGGPCILMRAPSVPGHWTLHIFDCTEGQGPHDWHQQITHQWAVQVTAPWSQAAPVPAG